MRNVTDQTTDAWTAAFKGGTDRPMQRATIEKLQVGLVPYDLSKVPTIINGNTVTSIPHDEAGNFASAMFCWSDDPIELPNIKSVKWSRGTDADVAQCTIELWNTEPLPLGQTPPDMYEFDIPGYYTPTRGATAESATRWGQEANDWRNLIAPDRVVRTYEGYGWDATKSPGQDSHMYQSGVWLIDNATFTNTGLITLEMRDLGRMLLDQIAFPPVIPFESYPWTFSWYHNVANPLKAVSTTGWFTPAYETDSNVYWSRAGYNLSAPVTMKGPGIGGHVGRLAFDKSLSTYWMGPSNKITHGHGWIQGKLSARPVGAVKVKAWNGPYRVYVSVYANGKWYGTAKVPQYDNDAPAAEGRRPYVAGGPLKKNGEVIIKLRQTYTNVTKIRVSITHIGTYGGDGQHCGLKEITVSGGVTTYVDGGTHVEGDGGDWTDIVKWMCAFGGFFWGKTEGTIFNHQKWGGGVEDIITPDSSDPIFPQGRVWGDFEQTGTNGKVDLDVGVFDKKPLMDIIAYVRDVVNFIFFVDEFGGVVWRSPNIWKVGNYVSDTTGGPHVSYDTDPNNIVEIADDETMLDMSMVLSSKNVRERVFVGSTTGQVGGMAAGIFSEESGPFQTGLRRVAGWTDQNFETAADCQIMADLIAVRSMFTYRTNSLTIPGYPKIQIDDQVRLYERTTSETYLHYVKGITSEFDMVTGKWTYALSTHWLGEEPFTKWVFDPDQLADETKEYLAAIGKI